MQAISIGVFGLAGVFSRYFIGLIALKYLPSPFPVGTFIINVVGAFLIGMIYVLGSGGASLSPELRLGLMVGFLGGFTTFSSYCLEVIHLIEGGKYTHAVAYFCLSPVLGTLATLLGIILTRKFLNGVL